MKSENIDLSKYRPNYSQESFRLLVQQELLDRTAKNPKYSLRSFARHLGLSAPVLSHLIGGRRSFSTAAIQKIGLALGLDPKEINCFITEATANKNRPLAEQAPLTVLAMDVFHSISEWYHDAILELTHVSTFQPEPKWIAKVLGLSVHEVNSAVERLKRLELLEIAEDQRWIDRVRDNTTQSHPDVTSAALKKYQKSILERSLSALENIPKPQRDHTSSLVAIDIADLDEVKLRIRNFRRELSTFLQRKGVKPNQVYQLAISYFPITNIETDDSETSETSKK